MREHLLDLLRSPRCRAERSLALAVDECDDREIRTGTLRCNRCGLERPVRDGIADLLHDPPEFVVREATGRERFAMRADGWDRVRILQLPNIEDPYWMGQRRAIRRLLETHRFRRGQRLLDVGSNTCWASNIFAGLGLDVVALDISMTPSDDDEGTRPTGQII